MILLREYPDTHYKMTISYPCIRFFVFVARIALPRGRAICLFLTPVQIRGRQKLLFSYPKFAKKPTPTLTLEREELSNQKIPRIYHKMSRRCTPPPAALPSLSMAATSAMDPNLGAVAPYESMS